MKIKIACFLLPLFLLSCSKQPTGEVSSQSPSPQQQSSNSSQPAHLLPFDVTVVETSEAKEIGNITNKANSFLAAKDYNSLDALAKKLRDSKESFADGTWKLSHLYEGLDLPDEAPDAEWQARLDALQAWINAKPSSITARVALANDLVSFGWKARGSDYANTVSDTDWKLFFQRLKDSVNVLKEAKTVNEQCPCWWTVLLKAELGLQVDRSKYDETFNSAVKAWPDYTSYYFRRAFYLMPQWYGKPGEWVNDLTASADKIGGDDGDVLYAQTVWYACKYAGSSDIFDDNKELSWKRVNAGFEVLQKRFPNSLFLENEGAHLAELAGDVPAARKYFGQTQGNVDLDSWQSKDRFIQFANWVYRQPQ